MSVNQRFHDWIHREIMLPAVSLEIPQFKQTVRSMSAVYKLLIKMADTIFSLFDDYNKERTSLKERLVRHLNKDRSSTSSDYPLQGRVSPIPESELQIFSNESLKKNTVEEIFESAENVPVPSPESTSLHPTPPLKVEPSQPFTPQDIELEIEIEEELAGSGISPITIDEEEPEIDSNEEEFEDVRGVTVTPQPASPTPFETNAPVSPASQDLSSTPPSQIVEKPVEPIEQVVEKPVEPIEQVVEKPVESLERTVEKPVESMGQVVEKPVEPLERTVEKPVDSMGQVVENPLEKLPMPSKPAQPEPSRFGTFLRTAFKVATVAFFGGLLFGGSLLTNRQIADSPTALSPRRKHDDWAFQEGLKIEGQAIDLQSIGWLQRTNESIYPSVSKHLTELGNLQTAVYNPATDLEDLSQRVNQVSEEINLFYIQAPATYTTSLGDLAKDRVGIQLSEAHMFALAEGNAQKAANLESSTALEYVKARLPLLGEKESEIRDRSIQLHTALSEIERFNKFSITAAEPVLKQLADAEKQMKQAQAEFEKIKDQNKIEAARRKLETTKEGIKEKLAVTWQLAHSSIKEQFSGTLLQAEQFIIKGGTKGELLHFIPEPSSEGYDPTWTVRLYSRRTAQSPALHYRPYKEQRGVSVGELLSDNFISSISGSMREYIYAAALEKAPAAQFLLPKVQQDSPLNQILKHPRHRPKIPNLYLRSLAGMQGMQTSLNDMIYIELGPEAALDFHISSIKHYIENAADTLKTNAEVFQLVRNALSDLSTACAAASRNSWITAESLADKTQILHSLQVKISHDSLHLRSHLRRQAPSVADESHGQRSPAKGNIPDTQQTSTWSLKKRSIVPLAAPKYVAPLKLTSSDSASVILSGKDLNAAELSSLIKALNDPSNASTAFREFRGWARYLSQNSDTLTQMNSAQASGMLSSLSTISEQLLRLTSISPQERGAALAEAAAIAEGLMRRLDDPNLKSAHMPLLQIARQFQNSILFGTASTVPPLVAQQTEMVKNMGGEQFFAEAIGNPQAITRGRTYVGSKDEPAPWPYESLRTLKDTASLPPNMKYLLTQEGLRGKNAEAAVSKYAEKVAKDGFNPPIHFKSLQTIVEANAKHAAQVLTEQIQQALDQVKAHSASNPELCLDAIKTWTRHLNPLFIAPTTLEMLTETQSMELLNAVGQLGNELLKASFKAGSPLPDPETMLSFLEMLAFADRVLAYSPVIMHNYHQLPLESFSSLIDSQNPFFRTFDPMMDERIVGLRKWLHERAKVSRFKVRPLFETFEGFFHTHPIAISPRKIPPELELLDYISSHEKISYLAAFRHSLSKKSSNFQMDLKGLLGEDSNTPAWISSLRELTYATYHTMRSGFVNPHPESSSPEDFTQIVFPDSMTPPTSIFHRLKGITPEEMQLYQIPDGSERGGHLFSHLQDQPQTPGVLRELSDLQLKPRAQKQDGETGYLPGTDMLSRSVYDLNIAMAHDANAQRFHDSSQNYRKKWAMRVEPDLQIFKTINEYLENPGWIENSDERMNFLNLLFDPGLLNRFLQTPEAGPKGLDALAKFLHRQFKGHQGKPEMQVFATEAAIRLNQYSQIAHHNAPSVYEAYPVPAELEALCRVPADKLGSKGLKSDERSSYGALRAISYLNREKLLAEEVPEFLNAVFSYHRYASVPMVNSVHVDRQIKTLLKRFAPNIQAALYSDGIVQPSPLNAALKDIIASPEKTYFTSSAKNSPFISSASGTINIDLTEGTVTQGGMEGAAMPMAARLSGAYKKIFGTAAFRGTYDDINTFQFTDTHGTVHVLQKETSSGQWDLYRKMDSQEPFKLMDWTTWDSGTRSWKNIPWLKSNWMLAHFTAWYRDGSSPEVRLLDTQGKETYRIEHSGHDKGLAIRGIYKQAPEGGRKLQLADIDQEEYRWIQELEDPGFVHVWLDTSSLRGQQIELPRFGASGLTFTQKEGRWHLDAEPQYYVDDPQFNPLFYGQSNFLRLHTAKGAERLLVPRFKPVLDKQGQLKFDRQPDSTRTQQLLVFDKNPRTGRFEGNTPEANTYLAFWHAANGDYGRAYDLLFPLLSHSSRLQPDAIESLDWIIRGEALPKPNDTPQAIGIRTLAAYAKSRTIEKFPAFEGEKYAVSEFLQDHYLRIVHDIPSLSLPLQEAAMLFKDRLTFSAKHNLPLDQALAQMQLSNPVAVQEALNSVLPKLLFNKQELRLSITSSSREPGAIISPREVPITQKEVDALIAFEPLNTTQKGELSQQTAALFNFKSDFFKSLSEPTQSLFRQYEDGAKEFQSGRVPGSYKLINKEGFAVKRASLEKTESDLILEMERLRLQILDTANPIPTDPKAANQLKLQMQAGTARPISFERLIGVFGSNDLRQYQSLNPALTLGKARELDRLMQTFIDLVPDRQYYKKLIDSMKEVEAATLKADTVEGRSLLHSAFEEFKAATTAGRQFPGTAPRLMKVLEYQTTFYYREGQVKNLREMGLPGLASEEIPTESAVHRITVGAGKTSRLLTTLMKAYAEKGILALAIIPEAQLPSAGREFASIMHDVYGIPTLQLEFKRKRLTEKYLASTLANLQEALTKGHPVLTSGKSLRVLRNLYIEHYKLLVDKARKGEDIAEQSGIVNRLRDIKKIISTRPIIDEIHKEYDSRIETNHPFGEAVALPKEYGLIALNLYDHLQDPDIQKLMHFDFAPKLHIKGSAPFSKPVFEAKIAPLLAGKFLDRLRSGKNLDQELLPLSKFVQELSSSALEELTNYLLPKHPDFPKRNVVPDWITKLEDQHIKNQLGMIRGELCVLLPQTLNQNFGERYGFAKPGDVQVTPFASAGRPNLNSQFSSFGERLNFLLQALLHEGPRRTMINTIIHELRQERATQLAAPEPKELPLGQRRETEADKEFQRLFNDESLSLDTSNLEEQLAERVARSTSLQRHLTKTYALSQVKVFPSNLKATSQHLGHMFPSWNGFSGTPGNFPTYPGNFKEPSDNAVIGRMLTLIAEQTFGPVQVLNVTDARDILADPAIRNADAFMDAGGLFATEDLESLADAWGESVGKARVRVDVEQGIVVKQQTGEKSIPLRLADVSSAKKVTLYGQPDIVGTDISHKRNAKGVVSVDKGTTFTEVEQAAGRMRGIEFGQTVELLVLEDDAILMRQKLGLSSDHVLTSTDVLQFTIINESEKQMADVEVALKHKLQAVIDSYVEDLIDANKLDPATPGLSELLDYVFFPSVSSSPFELYGQSETTLTKGEFFNNEIDRLINRAAPIFRPVFGDKSVSILANLREEMNKVLEGNLRYVRSHVPSRPAADLEQEQELLQEVEQETEVEVEQETELEQHQHPPAVQVRKHDTWKDLGEIRSWNFWQPSHPPSSGQACFTAVQDIMKQNEETELLAGLFDPDLVATTNYQQDAPLKAPQKPAQFIAVVKNTEQEKIEVAFLDTYDAARLQKAWQTVTDTALPEGPSETGFSFSSGFRTHLSDSSNPVLKEHFQLGNLYTEMQTIEPAKTSPDSNVWVGSLSGRQAFGSQDAFSLKDPSVKKLWAQAQLYGGRFDFQGDENRKLLIDEIKQLLDQWASSKASLSKPKQAWLEDAQEKFKKMHASQEDVMGRWERTDVGKIFNNLLSV